MKKFILDASAFIAGIKPLGEACYTVHEVIAELESEEAKLRAELSIREGLLKLIAPEKKHIKKIKEVAKNSGDIARLSEADIALLAGALQMKKEGAALVTDDYSVQNVARLLNIEFVAATEQGIKKIFTWRKVCRGCGKKFPSDYRGVCNVCGSEVRQVRKKTKA